MRNKVIALCTLACMFGTEGSKAQFVFDNQAELAAARMGVERAARVYFLIMSRRLPTMVRLAGCR